MKLTINRDKWLRRSRDSYLLRGADGKMCCLGFLAKACGARDEDILNITSPQAVGCKDSFKIKWPESIYGFTGYDTFLCQELMKSNDNFRIDDSERESQLTIFFKDAGIDVVFINGEYEMEEAVLMYDENNRAQLIIESGTRSGKTVALGSKAAVTAAANLLFDKNYRETQVKIL